MVHTMSTLLIKNPAQIVSPRPGSLRGAALNDPVVRTGRSVLLRDGHIAAIAPLEELDVPQDAKVLDATGRTVIPGLVDCHTHLVFGGSRADEFAQRTAGATYEEIAAKGGGIAGTVQATRESSKDELFELAEARLNRAMRHGVTTMEVKSGYGLDLTTELKMLEVTAELDAVHPVDLVPTFLGAHAVPKGVSKADYLAQVREMIPEAANSAKFCDVFCEEGYFTPAESVEIMELAVKHGMLPRLHADQFNAIGCVDVAIDLGAVSVDHLEAMNEEGAKKLAASDVVGVLLPGVSLFLDIPYAPARTLIDAGCIPAIATDFNPGSNMTLNLPLMMSLACMQMRMSVDEALACVTQNAAHALRLPEAGCIEPGWQADLLVLDTANYRDLVYFYGENLVQTVIKKGVPHAAR